MARYTVLRLLLFFACLLMLWFTPLSPLWTVVLAGIISMAISFPLLRDFREDAAHSVEAAVKKRSQRVDAHDQEDRIAEDVD